MNPDQGSQLTSFVGIDWLKRAGTRISIDGKTRCIDSIFIKHLWRSLSVNAFICMDGRLDQRPKRASGSGWPSTTIAAHLHRVAEPRQPCSIGTSTKYPNPINRSKEQLNLHRKPSQDRRVAHCGIARYCD
jgi:hypothetical protein